VKMRHTLSFLAAFLACTCLFAVDYGVHTIGPYGTLNDVDNPLVIPSNKAQDLLNVDLSPDGKMVKKRKGYASVFSLTHSTSALHGLYNFYNTGGNDVSLFFHDNEMAASVNGASETVLFTTGTVAATYDCTDWAGHAYCVDTGREQIIKTDGATYSQMAPTNNGTMITSTPERLVLAGFSATPNRIDFSEANDVTDWTVASLPTDPITYSIIGTGAKITHITYAFNRVMWFKDSSFGYLLEGPTHGDWVNRTVSPTIGTNDNTSVYWNGILYFRGQDGHIYGFDGARLNKLSRDVDTFISKCQTLRRNSWGQTSSADFDAGIFTFDSYIDTETVSGQLQLTFPDEFTSFRDGTGGTKRVWREDIPIHAGGDGSIEIENEEVKLIASASSVNGGIRMGTPTQLDDFAKGTTYHFKIVDFSTYSATDNVWLYVVFSTSLYTTEATLGLDYWKIIFKSTASNKVGIHNVRNTRDGVIESGFESSWSLPVTVDLYISTSNYNFYVNSVSTASGSHTWPNNKVWVFFEFFHTIEDEVEYSVTLDDFSVAPSTPIYDSIVFNSAGMESWDSFMVTNADVGGSHDFYVRSSTEYFPANSVVSTIAWTTISDGAIPSIATGTYIQFRDRITVDDPEDKPVLYDFSFNWSEGAADDKAYGIYFDDCIWWSLTYDDTTVNNRILKLDLNNNGWLVYDLPANGFMTRGSDLYFGDSGESSVHKFGDADNDNGSAINSYWKSKDFFIDSPFTEKEFNLVSFVSKSIENSTATVTYTLDASTEYSYEIETYESGSAFYQNNRNLPQSRVGKTINVKFGNNAADQYWELYGLQVGIRSKPWRETQ